MVYASINVNGEISSCQRGSEVDCAGEDSGLLLALSPQSVQSTFLMLGEGCSDGSSGALPENQWP